MAQYEVFLYSDYLIGFVKSHMLFWYDLISVKVVFIYFF